MAHVFKCNWCGALVDYDAAMHIECEFSEITVRKLSEFSEITVRKLSAAHSWQPDSRADIMHACGDCTKRIKAAIKPL